MLKKDHKENIWPSKKPIHPLCHLISCAIDAKENRYIIVTEVPEAFLHAGMEDREHMSLEGTIAD